MSSFTSTALSARALLISATAVILLIGSASRSLMHEANDQQAKFDKVAAQARSALDQVHQEELRAMRGEASSSI